MCVALDTGNEAPITEFIKNTGALLEYAPKFKAMVRGSSFVPSPPPPPHPNQPQPMANHTKWMHII